MPYREGGVKVESQFVGMVRSFLRFRTLDIGLSIKKVSLHMFNKQRWTASKWFSLWRWLTV
jgi:hypothetical protein